MYEYTRQTDEELSFPEDANLAVFDTSDPDWILVGLDGDFGFAPSNYIELDSSTGDNTREPTPPPPSLPARPTSTVTPGSPDQAPVPELKPDRGTSLIADGPAAALASVIQSRDPGARASSPPPPQLPSRVPTRSESPESIRSPTLPTRPKTEVSTRPREVTTPVTPTFPDIQRPRDDVAHSTSSSRAPGGFHMYNVNEMVSVMGKRKKMPTTLGINIRAKTILIAPEHVKDGPSQEWSGNKMTHYSREGKHVFLELVRPSKSVDFHAGAKDTAEEIVAALGELAAAVRADDLPAALLSPTGQAQKTGQVLYDFMAQGDDEVTVNTGDDVVILDDTKSEEWWQVRSMRTGKEGVVPSSYIEVTGFTSSVSEFHGVAAGMSSVEQNRLEEIRLTKEAVRAQAREQSPQVGPGMPLPERGSSLSANEHYGNSSQQRNKREGGRDGSGQQQKASKSSTSRRAHSVGVGTNADNPIADDLLEPDPSKVRTWTDRSKSFSVEAQFLGIKDGKINLHKVNGVKIAVPVEKMSHEDLEFVERFTGGSLGTRGPNGRRSRSDGEGGRSANSKLGATIEQRKPDFDWFQFFLDCDVNVGLCERYAQAFVKESMDESILSDVDSTVLRTLGLREGDIIKVMRSLDSKFGRSGKKESGEPDTNGQGGLFSGPGGTLRNNTRKSRPAPAVQTGDVVDPMAFSQTEPATGAEVKSSTPTATASSPGSQTTKPRAEGFDDDAWDVKPARQQAGPSPTPAVAPPEKPNTTQDASRSGAITGSMQELSLLTLPLKPTPAPASTAVADAGTSGATVIPAQPQSPPQLPGASPSFFTTLSSVPESQPGPPRQRPQPPQVAVGQGPLAPPPPTRPLSAPQAAQPSAFNPPPLMPQMTGSVHPALQGQVAPPGQSLSEIDQARLRDQYLRQIQATTQLPPYGVQGMTPGLVPLATGIQGPLTQTIVPGAMPTPGPYGPLQQQQPGNFSTAFPAQQQFPGPRAPSLNTFLPPPLEPQRTGMPIAPGPVVTPAPLIPQQTGPAPPVRFGVQGNAPRLAPQPTGRRANLAHASKLFPIYLPVGILLSR